MSDCREAMDALKNEAASAEVVIYRSRITDARPVTEWLERHGVAWREIEMAMGSSLERERFRCLEEMTGWELLPQIFIQGEFVGGLSEFFAHPLVREREGS